MIIKRKTSGHWYSRDKKPAYGATLREARKEDLLPSVTTILGIIAKPGLVTWQIEQGILAGMTLPREENEDLDNFTKRVAIDSQETSKKAARTGTYIHKQIENYLCEEEIMYFAETTKNQIELNKALKDAIDWCKENIKDGNTEQICMNKTIGYAGKIDFHGILKDGRSAIIDFKTQGIKNERLRSYPEHIKQITAYGKMLPYVPDVHMNVYISTSDSEKKVFIKEYTVDQLVWGWEAFKASVYAYYVEKKLGGCGLEMIETQDMDEEINKTYEDIYKGEKNERVDN